MSNSAFDQITSAVASITNSDGTLNVNPTTGAAVVSAATIGAGLFGGRLTLSSNTPVMTADVTAASTVYYTPYNGPYVPVYNGTIWVMQAFTQLSLALDSSSGHTGYQQSGKLFDLFVFLNSGTLALGTGPAWSSSTVRGTGAGTTELQRKNNVYTNANSIALKVDTTASQVTISVNQATYVGTMYATANGQTGIALKPAAAAGGTNNILGLWNAYNQTLIHAISSDNTSSWTWNSSTPHAMNASTSNRISWTDGLQTSFIKAFAANTPDFNGNTFIQVGTALNATNSIGLNPGSLNTGVTICKIQGSDTYYPQLGFNFIQATELVGSGTATFFSPGTLEIDIAM